MSDDKHRTFFQLYSQGMALADDIDDHIDMWRAEYANVPEGRTVPLHDYLGLTWDEYAVWATEPDVLPLILVARVQHRPLQAVVSDHLNADQVAARADDRAALVALRNWLAAQNLS